jgi:hypothetical protein
MKERIPPAACERKKERSGRGVTTTSFWCSWTMSTYEELVVEFALTEGAAVLEGMSADIFQIGFDYRLI